MAAATTASTIAAYTSSKRSADSYSVVERRCVRNEIGARVAGRAQEAVRDALDRPQRLDGHVLVAARAEPDDRDRSDDIVHSATTVARRAVPAAVARVDGDVGRRQEAGEQQLAGLLGVEGGQRVGDLVERPGLDDVPPERRLHRPDRLAGRRGDGGGDELGVDALARRGGRRGIALVAARPAPAAGRPRVGSIERSTAIASMSPPSPSSSRTSSASASVGHDDVAHAHDAELLRRRRVQPLELGGVGRGDPRRAPTCPPRSRRSSAATLVGQVEQRVVLADLVAHRLAVGVGDRLAGAVEELARRPRRRISRPSTCRPRSSLDRAGRGVLLDRRTRPGWRRPPGAVDSKSSMVTPVPLDGRRVGVALDRAAARTAASAASTPRTADGGAITAPKLPARPTTGGMSSRRKPTRNSAGSRRRGIGTTSWRASSFYLASRDSRRSRVVWLSFSSSGASRAWSADDRDVGQPEAVALGAQEADGQQRLGRRRQRAVAVLPLGADVVDLAPAS